MVFFYYFFQVFLIFIYVLKKIYIEFKNEKLIILTSKQVNINFYN